jgi:glycosyltransferase involved in cell wall biosynthesis
MGNLVSVIIPCFNAERWLREAIESCLNQTYTNLEVIIVDDGSTDQSLEIIKSYGDRVIWESQPNRGGCSARNRGFALSKGDYIQYLDADDYILPEKIKKQVACLSETGVDVVYGDWRYQKHLPDGTILLDAIHPGGPKEDFLESLLADTQWLAPMALLFTRTAVIRSGGWDESLNTGQDRDFFISVTLSGAKFHYQAGCDSIYRRYGNVTVSTSSKKRWRDGHFALMEKVETRLSQSGQLSEHYRRTLAHAYYSKIRADRITIDDLQYSWVLRKIISLDPTFSPLNVKRSYSWIHRLLGFQNTEKTIRTLRKLGVS